MEESSFDIDESKTVTISLTQIQDFMSQKKQENILGNGAFGTVYKIETVADLNMQKSFMAAKHLNLKKMKMSKPQVLLMNLAESVKTEFFIWSKINSLNQSGFPTFYGGFTIDDLINQENKSILMFPKQFTKSSISERVLGKRTRPEGLSLGPSKPTKIPKLEEPEENQDVKTQYLLLTELLEGTLSSLLTEQRNLKSSDPLSLNSFNAALILGAALDSFHSMFIHCDLKPDNILIQKVVPNNKDYTLIFKDEHYTLKISDFGISVVREVINYCNNRSLGFGPMLLLSSIYSEKFDLFSLAIVLIELEFAMVNLDSFDKLMQALMSTIEEGRQFSKYLFEVGLGQKMKQIFDQRRFKADSLELPDSNDVLLSEFLNANKINANHIICTLVYQVYADLMDELVSEMGLEIGKIEVKKEWIRYLMDLISDMPEKVPKMPVFLEQVGVFVEKIDTNALFEKRRSLRDNENILKKKTTLVKLGNNQLILV
jgi:serine/threonine protein kinase